MNKYTNNFIFNKNVYYYCDLKKIFEKYPLLRKLPNSAKILLESNIRNAKEEDISSIISTFIHRNYLNKIEFNCLYTQDELFLFEELLQMPMIKKSLLQ